ncbi:hypothetical protein THAOC_34649, partial [Thalassiosira oceanica]
DETHYRSFERLESVLLDLYGPAISSETSLRLASDGFAGDLEVVHFAKGLVSREERISTALIEDFGWKAMDAHRARVGIVGLLSAVGIGREGGEDRFQSTRQYQLLPPRSASNERDEDDGHELSITTPATETEDSMDSEAPPENKTRASWKSVVINDKARLRRAGGKARDADPENGPESKSKTSKDAYSYGLLPHTEDNADRRTYRTLYEELDALWTYMTVQQASSVSDPPVRERTAEVYMRHARLFLGWIVDARGGGGGTACISKALASSGGGETDDGGRRPSSPLASSRTAVPAPSGGDADAVRASMWSCVRERTGESSASPIDPDGGKIAGVKRTVSLYDVFPSADTDSAAPVLQYILWLRSERGISSNYEANMENSLRGLIKLVKFRFAGDESVRTSGQLVGNGAHSSQASSLDNLPIIIELRKFHRLAGLAGKKANKSSDESKKWLDWHEYLDVIQQLKADLFRMIEGYESKHGGSGGNLDDVVEKKRKAIAVSYQHYLLLSFFACIPDRQRTFRELELDRSFMRVGSDGEATYVIKHTSDDYKTGKSYGERPALPLGPSLTPEIDDFISRWRPALIQSKGEDSQSPSFLFLQPKTGKPLTSNSVYQIVSRNCYKYKQKKTNPHLLRDMIVTHVRQNGDASEKELEALALFMGHSIQMQRESYDRRTLEQKVTPAVKLMQDMNSFENPQ